jgi:pyrroloquinoline-quinone synthase
MTLAPRVTACADGIIRRTGLLENPYLVALCSGAMSLECFRVSQEQFFFAVRYFPRPMAALIARLPDPAQRVDILHNIVEEHGDFREQQFHANTFRRFLASIGARGENVASLPVSPAVHGFNSILMGACGHDELEVGVCCLGIIEHSFAQISARIGKAVVERGWVDDGNLVHYTTHAELDVRHAEEFFAIVEPGWDDQRRRVLIQQGLELGAYAFDQLYRGMYIQKAG